MILPPCVSQHREDFFGGGRRYLDFLTGCSVEGGQGQLVRLVQIPSVLDGVCGGS